MARFVKIYDTFVNPDRVEFVAPTEFDGVTKIVMSSGEVLRADMPIDQVLRRLQPPPRKERD